MGFQFGFPEIPSPSASSGSLIARISWSETSSINPKPVLAGGVKFENGAPDGICSGVKPGIGPSSIASSFGKGGPIFSQEAKNSRPQENRNKRKQHIIRILGKNRNNFRVT